MKLAFWQRSLPLQLNDIWDRPLGGTESALIFIARALALRGHHVDLFANMRNATGAVLRDMPRTLQLLDTREFETHSEQERYDAIIYVRAMMPLLGPRRAPVQVLWTPDAYDQPFLNAAFAVQLQVETHTFELGLYSLRNVAAWTDAIFCVGEWQRHTLLERFGVPAPRCVMMGNGVHLPHFSNPPLAKRTRQLVYASTPFRGLEFLLRWFPKIRERVPDATLAVMSGMQLYGVSDAQDHAEYASLYALAKQPGVTLCGPLAKSQMGKIFSESRVLAYPNTFAETFCIAALEAQAAGLPIVSTQLGAMPERVRTGVDGVLIPGSPHDSAYANAFIDACCHLLTDDAAWQAMHTRMIEQVTPWSYERRAVVWEKTLQDLCARAKQHPNEKFFLPTAQRCHVNVGGYPKEVSLTAQVIARHVAAALVHADFPRAAEALLHNFC